MCYLIFENILRLGENDLSVFNLLPTLNFGKTYTSIIHNKALSTILMTKKMYAMFEIQHFLVKICNVINYTGDFFIIIL